MTFIIYGPADFPFLRLDSTRHLIGLATGLQGRAQIGKGMWAMPDEMKAMYDSKMAHLEAGANCAWATWTRGATGGSLEIM